MKLAKISPGENFWLCGTIDKGGGEGLETAVIGAFLFFVYL